MDATRGNEGVSNYLSSEGFGEPHNVDFSGLVVAEFIVAGSPSRTKRREVHLGCLVTLILEYIVYETTPVPLDYKVQYLYREHLQHIKVLIRGHKVLQFMDRDGIFLNLQLPAPEFTTIVSRDQVELLLPDDALCRRPSTCTTARRVGRTATHTDASATTSTFSQTPLLDFDEYEFIALVR